MLNSSEIIIKPVEKHVKDDLLDARFVLLSSSDVETCNSYIEKGYRISAILPSRIYQEGNFHSLIELQKIYYCDPFPREEPDQEKWKKHLPGWPPKITLLTHCFMQVFNVLESYPVEERKYFPWKPEKEFTVYKKSSSAIEDYILQYQHFYSEHGQNNKKK